MWKKKLQSGGFWEGRSDNSKHNSFFVLCFYGKWFLHCEGFSYKIGSDKLKTLMEMNNGSTYFTRTILENTKWIKQYSKISWRNS